MTLRRGLDGRLRADDGKRRIRFAQRPDGSAGRRVARDHERLRALSQKLLRRLQAQLRYLFGCFRAIGCVEGVSEIEIVFHRQRPDQLAQNADAAESRVKHRNRCAAIRHASSLLKKLHYLVYAEIMKKLETPRYNADTDR